MGRFIVTGSKVNADGDTTAGDELLVEAIDEDTARKVFLATHTDTDAVTWIIDSVEEINDGEE